MFSAEIQYAWLSDREYSIHLISMEDAEISDDEIDKDGNKQKSIVLSGPWKSTFFFCRTNEALN